MYILFPELSILQGQLIYFHLPFSPYFLIRFLWLLAINSHLYLKQTSLLNTQLSLLRSHILST